MNDDEWGTFEMFDGSSDDVSMHVDYAVGGPGSGLSHGACARTASAADAAAAEEGAAGSTAPRPSGQRWSFDRADEVEYADASAAQAPSTSRSYHHYLAYGIGRSDTGADLFWEDEAEEEDSDDDEDEGDGLSHRSGAGGSGLPVVAGGTGATLQVSGQFPAFPLAAGAFTPAPTPTAGAHAISALPLPLGLGGGLAMLPREAAERKRKREAAGGACLGGGGGGGAGGGQRFHGGAGFHSSPEVGGDGRATKRRK